MNSNSHRRLRPRFGLRILFVLMIAVAIGSAVLAAKFREAEHQRRIVAHIRAAGGTVTYDEYWQLDEFGIPSLDSPQRRHAWLRDIFGDDFLVRIVSVHLGRRPESVPPVPHGGAIMMTLVLTDPTTSDDDLRLLRELPGLRAVRLDGASIGDAGLAHLKGLTTLTNLDLSETRITDDGLRVLVSLPNLRILRLCGTNVTDAGLAHVAKCSLLEDLAMADTRVTETGMLQLRGLNRLRSLYADYEPDVNQAARQLTGRDR